MGVGGGLESGVGVGGTFPPLPPAAVGVGVGGGGVGAWVGVGVGAGVATRGVPLGCGEAGTPGDGAEAGPRLAG